MKSFDMKFLMCQMELFLVTFDDGIEGLEIYEESFFWVICLIKSQLCAKS